MGPHLAEAVDAKVNKIRNRKIKYISITDSLYNINCFIVKAPLTPPPKDSDSPFFCKGKGSRRSSSASKLSFI